MTEKAGSGSRRVGKEGRFRIWKGWEAGFGLKAMAKNAGLKPRINLSAAGKSRIFFASTWCIVYKCLTHNQNWLHVLQHIRGQPTFFKSYVHKSVKSALLIVNF